MSTFLQMRSRIADDLNRSDLDTQIQKAINRAITYYESEYFWFKETTGTFSTANQQESYSSSDAAFFANITKIDLVRLTIAADYIPILHPRTYEFIEKYNISNTTTTGQPFDYCWYQNKIYLSPIPNGIYTVTVSYQKNYSTLSNDSDTNDFLTYGEDLIEARARAWVYARVIKDMEQAQIAQTEEGEALAALRKKNTRLVSSRTLQYKE